MKEAFVSAVIVAAGSANRMNIGSNKNFIELEGKQILLRSVLAFQKSRYIKEIIVVIKERELSEARRILDTPALFAKIKYVSGGATRQESVFSGIKAVDSRCTHIAVHDGARPLVSTDEINGVIGLAIEKNAASAACAAVDTMALAADGKITGYVERSAVYHIQTPQVFERSLLLKAHEKALGDGYSATDDTSLAVRMGADVYISECSSDNIKITAPEDIIRAQAILARKNKEVDYADR